MSRLIATAATLLGLVPFVWLGMGPTRSRVWWWMALGFAVSFVADVIASLSHPVFVSQLYPVTQAAFFVCVLSPRKYIEWIIGGLLCLAAISVSLRQAQGLDVLFHVTAWGTVAVLASHTTGTLRKALLLYFAGGAVTWMGYVAVPAWSTWVAYQMTRALGIGLWCAASRERTA